MAKTNPRYRPTTDGQGWERDPSAPPVTRPSNVNIGRVNAIVSAVKAVQDLRKRQNEKNKAHRKKHGG